MDATELTLFEIWGSKHPDNRAKIRKHLYTQLRDLGDTTTHFSRVLGLGGPPSSDHYSISVSHSDSLGGYVLLKKPQLIGLDIEPTDRVTDSVIKRLGYESWLSSAPAGVLFTALEATYKCLSGSAIIKVLSELQISSCDILDKDLYEIKILNPKSSQIASVLSRKEHNHWISIAKSG